MHKYAGIHYSWTYIYYTNIHVIHVLQYVMYLLCIYNVFIAMHKYAGIHHSWTYIYYTDIHVIHVLQYVMYYVSSVNFCTLYTTRHYTVENILQFSLHPAYFYILGPPPNFTPPTPPSLVIGKRKNLNILFPLQQGINWTFTLPHRIYIIQYNGGFKIGHF